MNRANLARQFAAPSPAPLKTFVVETHANGDTVGYLEALAGELEFLPTEDRYLYQLVGQDLEFWVDTLDDRFWSFHTWSKTAESKRFLKEQLESRRDLDWMWLPSHHLWDVWPTANLRSLLSDFRGDTMLPDDTVARDVRVRVDGADSGALLQWIAQRESYAPAVSVDRVAYAVEDPDFGQAEEAVHRLGRFVAGGDSFELHQEIVRRVTRRYKHLVEVVEAKALSFGGLPEGGFVMAGTPIVVRYRSVPDMDLFVDELFSAREPFRIWGLADRDSNSNMFHVDAVDLHVGLSLGFDVAEEWLRVYLPAGACGNTVIRLVANLQHHFDGQLHFDDPELQSAFAPTAMLQMPPQAVG